MQFGFKDQNSLIFGNKLEAAAKSRGAPTVLAAAVKQIPPGP